MNDEFKVTRLYDGRGIGAFNGFRWLAAAITSDRKAPRYTPDKRAIIILPEGCKIDLGDFSFKENVTIGNYLHGSYPVKDSDIAFTSESSCLELVGRDFDRVADIAMQICRKYQIPAVLFKNFCGGTVYLVERNANYSPNPDISRT